MITVTITEDTLTKFQAKRGRPEACANGLALFRQIATMSKRSPSGKLRIKVKWTRLHQLWAARDSFESAKLTTGEFNEP